jgi:hypothetical protein
MISVTFAGGLGNQLFQIFTVLAHMFKNNLVLGLEDKTILDGYATTRTVHWNDIFKNLKVFRNSRSQYLDIYREQAFHYVEIPKLDNIRLQGYFQSPKYFDQHKHEIMALLEIKEMIEPLRETIGRERESVGIHFRWGDYAANQNYHHLLRSEYYVNALQHICCHDDTVDTVTFMCEDHDLEFAKIVLTILHRNFPTFSFRRIKAEDGHDQDEMLLYSLCKHHIIANSTFSWWGAYLAERPGIVCYPDKWFGPSGPKDTEDLFPDSWTKIDAEK